MLALPTFDVLDAPEWPTLQGLATALFGEGRAAKLLSPTDVP